MKTWAWILGIGGAFTAFAGYMASRAQASALASLPPGVVVPPGTPFTSSDATWLSSVLATKQREDGSNFNMATWAQGVNEVIAGFALYRSDYGAWVAMFRNQSPNATPLTSGRTFAEFATVYG